MLHISVDINHFISAPDSRISHSTNCVLYRLAGAKRDIYIHLTFHMELHETTHYATNKQAYVTTTKPHCALLHSAITSYEVVSTSLHTAA